MHSRLPVNRKHKLVMDSSSSYSDSIMFCFYFTSFVLTQLDVMRVHPSVCLGRAGHSSHTRTLNLLDNN